MQHCMLRTKTSLGYARRLPKMSALLATSPGLNAPTLHSTSRSPPSRAIPSLTRCMKQWPIGYWNNGGDRAACRQRRERRSRPIIKSSKPSLPVTRYQRWMPCSSTWTRSSTFIGSISKATEKIGKRRILVFGDSVEDRRGTGQIREESKRRREWNWDRGRTRECQYSPGLLSAWQGADVGKPACA